LHEQTQLLSVIMLACPRHKFVTYGKRYHLWLQFPVPHFPFPIHSHSNAYPAAVT